MKIRIVLFLLFLISPVFAQTDWSKIEAALGRRGTVKDYVLKVTFPRSDLKVKVGDVTIEPGLALTSWLAFLLQDNVTTVMGDMVLLDTELPAVEAKLIEDGIGITAIHNHLVGEFPAIKYIHVEAKGDGEKIAEKLKNAFSLTGTPPPQTATAVNDTDWSEVESILGIKGTPKGKILQFSIPRIETIKEHAMEIPPYMGLTNSINIQKAGDKLATTGDFVLIASEVRPVMKALEKHGFVITALHNHMLMENPRMFMMHFWGYDKPARIALGIFTALKEIHISLK